MNRDWLTWAAAVEVTKERLSLPGSDGAELLAAVREGKVLARSDGKEFSGFDLWTRLARKDEAAVNMVKTLEVRRNDVTRWLDGKKVLEEQPENRGRKAKYDWDSAWAFMTRVIRDEGRPATQADLVRKVQDWFAQKDLHPPESAIKDRVSKLWRELA